MIKLVIGLICVMSSNILLGATIAKIKKEFNIKSLLNGIFKAGMLLISTMLVYACGYLNPTITAIEINGNMFNLMEAIRLICTTGVIYYGALSIQKITNTIKVSCKVCEESISNDSSDNTEIKD